MKFLIFMTGLCTVLSCWSYGVHESGGGLWVTCSDETSSMSACQKLCQSNECQIAEFTCEACARSSDPMFVGILKRFHRIYDINPQNFSPESLKPWIAKGMFIAIGSNSPLNIFADPFSEADTAELAESLNRVCGTPGNHYVLATQEQVMKPQGLICQTGSNWQIRSLKYRDDYFSSPAQVPAEYARP